VEQLICMYHRLLPQTTTKEEGCMMSNEPKENEGIQQDEEAVSANEKINEDFYEDKRNLAGVSPALLLNTAPIVDTDDLYYLDQNEKR
jgi:hypothetical protein